jgi:peptide-methionine (R)-S-oxide reductase
MKLPSPKFYSVISVTSVALVSGLVAVSLLLYTPAKSNKMENLKDNSQDKSTTQLHSVEGRSPEDLRQRLTPEQFYVTQQKGTEAAFTGEFWNHHEKGMYRCVVCGAELFASQSKFDSGCGWPSFDKPVNDTIVDTQTDTSHGMVRDEITCNQCGAHLGHVFPDGPTATGLRYCVNSASLTFEPKDRE